MRYWVQISILPIRPYSITINRTSCILSLQYKTLSGRVIGCNTLEPHTCSLLGVNTASQHVLCISVLNTVSTLPCFFCAYTDFHFKYSRWDLACKNYFTQLDQNTLESLWLTADGINFVSCVCHVGKTYPVCCGWFMSGHLPWNFPSLQSEMCL